MNPFVNLLMSRFDPGGGVQFAGNGMDDLSKLTDALASYKRGQQTIDGAPQQRNAAPGASAPPTQAPIDRIKAAFDDLKNMHKGPNQTPDNTSALAPMSPMDRISAAFGVFPQSSGVPMPQPRPADAPQAPQVMANTPAGSPYYGPLGADTSGNQQYGPLSGPDDQSPLMSFFKRNAAMQRDPTSGNLLDPSAAASAGPGILSSLFG